MDTAMDTSLANIVCGDMATASLTSLQCSGTFIALLLMPFHFAISVLQNGALLGDFDRKIQ